MRTLNNTDQGLIDHLNSWRLAAKFCSSMFSFKQSTAPSQEEPSFESESEPNELSFFLKDSRSEEKGPQIGALSNFSSRTENSSDRQVHLPHKISQIEPSTSRIYPTSSTEPTQIATEKPQEQPKNIQNSADIKVRVVKWALYYKKEWKKINQKVKRELKIETTPVQLKRWYEEYIAQNDFQSKEVQLSEEDDAKIEQLVLKYGTDFTEIAFDLKIADFAKVKNRYYSHIYKKKKN